MKTTNSNSIKNNPNVDIVNNLTLKTHETEEEYFEALNSDYSYLPQISYVENAFSNTAKTVEISDVVDHIKNGTYKEIIQEIRNEDSYDKKKELKLTLPAVMFGGTFEEDRTNPTTVSRLICLDFDHVASLESLKKKLKWNQSVYMFFTSPSGDGLKVIIRSSVQNSEEYKTAVYQLFQQFEELKLFADSQKQSINDLCFYSYDENIYFNPKATIWRNVDFSRLFIPADHELPKILEGFCTQLEDMKRDLTRGNNMTYDIGLALANKLGEDGRSFYHRICKLNDQYDEEILDIEYDSCIENFQFGSISSLIFLADASGINITSQPSNAQEEGELSEYAGQPLNKDNILLATNGGLKFYKHVIPDLRGGSRTKKNVKNPFYKDTKGSLSIYFTGERWYFKDHGESSYQGDVFDFAGHCYKLKTYSKDFYKILQHINDDLNLGLIEGKQADENPDFEFIPEYDDENRFKIYYKRDFSIEDLKYWEQYGITTEILNEFKVKAIKRYQILLPSGQSHMFYSTIESPFFAFVYSDEAVKVYKPKDDTVKYFWIGNKNNTDIFGLSQCMNHDPHGEWEVLITGGEKDVMTLHSLEYFAVCLNSETANIPLDLLEKLKNFYKSVLVLYDTDSTGIKQSNFLAQNNSLVPIFLPEEFMKENDGKDVSDYISAGGSKEELENLIEKASDSFIKRFQKSDENKTPAANESSEEKSFEDNDSEEDNEDQNDRDKNKKSEEVKTKSRRPSDSIFPLVSDKIIDQLPRFLQDGLRIFENDRERDVFLYSMIGVLSGCLPNIYAHYDGSEISANLYLLILAPPSSNKSVAKWAKKVGKGIHKLYIDRFDSDYEDFKQEMEDYNKQSKDSDEDKAKPIQPDRRLLFIPANASASAFLKHLKGSNESGILFEMEADTLSNTLRNDWGNYSDSLRKAFHHEDISVARKGNGELIEIEEPKLSVVLSGTPGQARTLISDIENGLFSRFMFYYFQETPFWKDTFKIQKKFTYSKEFIKLGDQLKDFYLVLENQDRDIKFSLSESQEEAFTIRFEDWLVRYAVEYGEEIAPSIKRLGLIVYRIAMILAAIRYYDKSELPDEIICPDQDFRSSLVIAENLLMHASLIFKLLPKSNSSTKQMPENKATYYNSLPKEFTKQEANTIADNLQLSLKTAEKYLNDFINERLLKRVKHGKYQKIE